MPTPRVRELPPPASTAVIGLQWGDEGKGKLCDLLAAEHDAVVRFNGGANAGHSVVVRGERYSLHVVPSGILYPGKLAVIANGVVVDPQGLLAEIAGLEQRGVDTSGLVLSDRAHVVMPYHKAEDSAREGVLQAAHRSLHGDEAGGLGTTKRGIGPCYAEKAQRAAAVRVGDLLRPEALRERLHLAAAIRHDEGIDTDALAASLLDCGRRLAPRICDTAYLLNGMAREGKRLLFEGGNATLLDVDHGTFPFVTSSACTALGMSQGSGVPAGRVSRVLGVMKAYTTRVGKGPLPTELLDATGDLIRERGREYGTTTGRPRRVGWLDLVAVRYSAMINGATGLAVMMMDVIAALDQINVCTAYRVGGEETDRFLPDGHALSRAVPVYRTLPGFGADPRAAKSRDTLPDNARRYLDLIEDFVGVPVDLVSVGPDREETILCR